MIFSIRLASKLVRTWVVGQFKMTKEAVGVPLRHPSYTTRCPGTKLLHQSDSQLGGSPGLLFSGFGNWPISTIDHVKLP